MSKNGKTKRDRTSKAPALVDQKEFTNPKSELPFVFKSHQLLWGELGRLDEAAGFMFVSCNSFLFETFMTEDFQAHINGRLALFSMKTSFGIFDEMMQVVARFALAGVYQHADAFLSDLQDECESMGVKWPEKGNTAPFDYVLRNVGRRPDTIQSRFSDNVNAVQEHRIKLFQYYKEIRDIFIHASRNKKRKDVAFNDIKDLQAVVAIGFNLSAPNHYDNLNFDDYLLFTRIVKYVSASLLKLAAPTADVQFSKLLEKAIVGPKPNAESSIERRNGLVPGVSGLLQVRQQPERAEHAIKTWFKQNYRYGFEGNPSALRACVDALSRIPNKHERRKNKIGTISDGKWIQNEETRYSSRKSKYTCKTCGLEASAIEEVKIICGNCNSIMIST